MAGFVTLWRRWSRKGDGASEGIRTLDTHVGNVMLYQAELRSLPESPFTLRFSRKKASPSFGRLLAPTPFNPDVAVPPAHPMATDPHRMWMGTHHITAPDPYPAP